MLVIFVISNQIIHAFIHILLSSSDSEVSLVSDWTILGLRKIILAHFFVSHSSQLDKVMCRLTKVVPFMKAKSITAILTIVVFVFFDKVVIVGESLEYLKSLGFCRIDLEVRSDIFLKDEFVLGIIGKIGLIHDIFQEERSKNSSCY